jgi:FtsP/CotA-like multicopper oxidase with cupredoxin domain
MIGAHYMFEMGATDQAKIGTVDDFYMINNLWEDHPMHIHLINHQAVRAYSLKQLPENPNCTLYFLDYFRQANLPQF